MRRFAGVDCVRGKAILLALGVFLLGADQKRLGAKLPGGGGGSVLTSSDLTYLGALRVANTGGVDTTTAYGSIGGRIVSGQTHIFLWGKPVTNGSPPSGGVPLVFEMNATTCIGAIPCVPNTTYTSAPRMTLVTEWGDLSDGTFRASWLDDGTPQNLANIAGAISDSLYWNESLGMLFMSYNINYTDTAKWSVYAATLDNPAGPTHTTYGPWKFQATDQQANVWNGNRAQFLFARPDGKMCAGGVSKSGNASIPWGPSAWCGNDWPTTATTGGFGISPITQTDEYLNYYYPTNISNVTGAATGAIQSFQYRNAVTTLTYVGENYGDGFNLKVDPTTNSGIGSWSDEASGMNGAVWIDGTHKDGVLFFGTLVAGAGSDTTNCSTTAHEAYFNAGQISIDVSSPSGNFIDGETVTDGTSGAVGAVSTWNSGTAHLLVAQTGPQQALNFGAGHVITGSTSGKTATMTLVIRHDVCTHPVACTPAVAVTGPGTTLSSGVIVIYDPATLEAVKNGATDYAQSADSIINVEATYGLQLAPQTELQANNLNGGFYNPSTHLLYVGANSADVSGGYQTLVHVFEVDDSAAPSPWWPLVGLLAVVSALAVKRA